MADRIAGLVRELQEGDDDAKARAAHALFHLAHPGNWVAIAAAAGAIEPLVALLLKTDSEWAKQNAARALGNLAQNNDNQVAIAAAGGIPPLVELLEAGSELGLAEAFAADALGYLAYDNDENKVAIKAAGGITPLMVLARAGRRGCDEAHDALEALAPVGQALLALPAEGICVVCWDQPRSVAIVPCGHLCLCAQCAAALNNCPICRAAATQLLTIRHP